MTLDPSVFKTGNPIESDDAKDLSDNARVIDAIANDTSGDDVLDRLGNQRSTLQGTLNKLGVIFDDPITDWVPGLVVSDLRAVRYPAVTGDIYIPTAPLPFTTGATFDPDKWEIYQGRIGGTIRVYPTASDMISSDAVTVGDVVATLGYYSESDGGGNTYLIVDSGTGTNDGGSYIDLTSHQAKGLFINGVDIKQFGSVSDGVTNDALAVSACADFAYNSGIRFVTVNDDTYINGDVPNKANVIFVGQGRFVETVVSNLNNIGIYRRQVVTESAKPAKAYPDNIQEVGVRNPATAKVVFFGDSLTTYAANSTSSSNTKSAHFIRMIRSSNPNTDFTFYNRAIGGESASAMNSKPAVVDQAAYQWYTDDQRDWLEYIYDLDPDVVVLATGMNEGPTFDPQDIYDIRSKIEANTEAAVVFVADYLPTISPVGINTGNTLAWYNAQEWRDRAAGFIRSYANFLRYPLIDLNRTFSMVRDGMDVLSQRYIKSEQYQVISGRFSVFQSGSARAWTLRCVLESGCFSNADPVTVGLDNNGSHRVWIRESGGFLTLRFLDNDGGNVDYTTDLPTPAADNEYEIVVTQTSFSIRDLTNGGRYARYEVDMVRLGGLAQPTLDYFAQPTGPVLSVGGYYQGTEIDCMPTVTDVEFFGLVESGFENEESGGDGKVHPSSLGLEALHGAHYSEQNFKLKSRDNNKIALTVNSVTSDFNYIARDDGSYVITGSAETDVSGNALIVIPADLARTFSLRDYSQITPWRRSADPAFIALIDSGNSGTTTLAVNTYDESGVAVGGRNFTFVINAY